MSAAFYVLLEDGVQPEMDGKALSRFSKRLPQLLDFVQMPNSELADLMDDETPGMEQELLWFTPETGLVLVESYLAQHQEPPELLHDLQAFQAALELATQRSTRWHLRIDF